MCWQPLWDSNSYRRIALSGIVDFWRRLQLCVVLVSAKCFLRLKNHLLSVRIQDGGPSVYQYCSCFYKIQVSLPPILRGSLSLDFTAWIAVLQSPWLQLFLGCSEVSIMGSCSVICTPAKDEIRVISECSTPHQVCGVHLLVKGGYWKMSVAVFNGCSVYMFGCAWCFIHFTSWFCDYILVHMSLEFPICLIPSGHPN